MGNTRRANHWTRWRALRRVPASALLDPARQIEIKHDDASGRWLVADGHGAIIKGGFMTNREAWAWVDRRHDNSRRGKRS
jgi:hypothetical protein